MKRIYLVCSIALFSISCLPDASFADASFDGTNLAVLTQNIRGIEIQFFNDSHASASENPLKSASTEKILQAAYRLAGTRYQAGGNTPETGFDCSGFVRYVFSQTANINLPASASSIYKVGKLINKQELQAGDLVFFNTLKQAYSHVAIYIGEEQFIHAPSPGGVVRVDQLNSAYWSSHYNGAKRIAID